MPIQKELVEIKERKKQIREELQTRNLGMSELEGIKQELEALEAREDMLNEKLRIASDDTIEERRIPKPDEEDRGEKRSMKKEMGFGKKLIEQRAAIASSSLVIPQLEQNYIEKKFNEVSGLLDLVRFMYIGSGNKYTVPYSNTVATGGITAEGSDYTETVPTFDEVVIDGIKVTAYTQYNEEVEKLPSADYEAFIADEIRNAINRKIIEQIVNGNGTSQFKGLYDTSIVQASSDISISAIDKDTLDNIVYGLNTSAEEVEGNLVLLLNKKDLGAFAKVRTTDGQKVYDISFNSTGQAGTINGVKFCICNSLKALSDSSVTADSYTMCYVNPDKYVIPVFSPFEFKKDYSTGFIQGKVTVKGSVILGGAPATPFMGARIKKVAAQ